MRCSAGCLSVRSNSNWPSLRKKRCSNASRTVKWNGFSVWGEIAREEGDRKTAQDSFEFIEIQTQQPGYRLRAALNLLEMAQETSGGKGLNKIKERYLELIGQYPILDQSLQLYLSYYNFLAFRLGEAPRSIRELKAALDNPLSTRSKARLKMLLGDILVFDQKFNQALVYFTQIQQELKNDVLAQQARFQVARTSFFKGDFDWSLTQLKVLRNSSTQLIANDAMQLSLTISDNNWGDTTQLALKKYARADLLAYQKKNKEAIEVLQDVLDNHKGGSN